MGAIRIFGPSAPCHFGPVASSCWNRPPMAVLRGYANLNAVCPTRPNGPRRVRSATPKGELDPNKNHDRSAKWYDAYPPYHCLARQQNSRQFYCPLCNAASPNVVLLGPPHGETHARRLTRADQEWNRAPTMHGVFAGTWPARHVIVGLIPRQSYHPKRALQ